MQDKYVLQACALAAAFLIGLLIGENWMHADKVTAHPVVSMTSSR